MPKPASEHDIVMVLVVVGHLQKRSALQAEKADHFELRKTTAGLLTTILRPLELVSSRIWHRQTGAVDNFDASTEPKLLVSDLAFELLGHLGETKSLHVLVDGGSLWPLAEQFMEPRTRSTAKEQRTKSGKERSRVAHANISIYTYNKTSFFDEKSLTFCHPNCGSQKTLRALQNSDLSPRLGDSRQSEPKPTGQLALDAKSQSQDRDGRPFRTTGRPFSSSH